MQQQEDAKFAAVVLAGSRGPDDPVAVEAGVAAKALAIIGGTPMVSRVVTALAESRSIGQIVVVGLTDKAPPEVETVLDMHRVRRVAGSATPSQSVIAAFSVLEPLVPVLVTTADHALLRSEYVDDFCARARATGADVAVALAAYQDVIAACPDTRRTVSRFSDGGYCGCNLFGFLTERGRSAVGFWRRVEGQRKNPVKVIRSLGFLTLLRYLTGGLSLRQGLEVLSRRAGARVEPVLMPHGEAAIDVDSADDLRRVRAMVERRESL